MTRGKGKVITVGAVIVAGAGYIAGILSAPKSGKETRKDIAKGVSTAHIKSEKQLKQLNSQISDLIKQADGRAKKAKSKVGDEYDQALAQAKKAKEKARLVLSALHDGEVDDPHLKAVIEDVKLATHNLGKFVKK